MTAEEWKLKKEVCELQIALAQSQMEVCRANFVDAQRRLKELGEEPPSLAFVEGKPPSVEIARVPAKPNGSHA